MKQRKVWTKIWKDDWFCGLSQSARMLFLYLITNEDIGFTGCYELSDRQITFDTKLTGLDKLKKELFPKIKFLDGWIYVVNAQGYNGFVGESFEVAISKERLSIPQNVKDTLIKGEGYPTPPVTPPSGGDHSSNSNSNNIYKEEVVKEKQYSKIDDLTDEDFKQLAEHYQIRESDVSKVYDAMYTWAISKGKTYKNYKAGLMTWIRTRIDEGKIKLKVN
jgi:hypothetical protein